MIAGGEEEYAHAFHGDKENPFLREIGLEQLQESCHTCMHNSASMHVMFFSVGISYRLSFNLMEEADNPGPGRNRCPTTASDQVRGVNWHDCDCRPVASSPLRDL